MIRLRRPAVAAIGFLTLAAAVALPLWTLADGATGPPTVTPPPFPATTPVATTAGAVSPSPAATNNGAVLLKAPIIKQDLALDCESAALQVALAVQNIDVPQDQIYASLPQDARPPVIGSHAYPSKWGDPFKDFVGDVNGYEPSFTGYGVYYPPMVTAAERYGAIANGHTGWSVAQIESQLRLGNSVVIWLTSDFKPHVPQYWTAWDGVRVPWAIGEHAVPVIGYDPVKDTITFVDVLYGVERTLTSEAFAAAMTTFGGMGMSISATF